MEDCYLGALVSFISFLQVLLPNLTQFHWISKIFSVNKTAADEFTSPITFQIDKLSLVD